MCAHFSFARRLVLLLIPALAACSSLTGSRTQPSITFEIDAPLCSSIIPAIFSIDNVEVARDTFRVHLVPERTKSRAIRTSPGLHTVSARTDFGFVWPTRTVNLTAGEAFTDSLPFYCS